MITDTLKTTLPVPRQRTKKQELSEEDKEIVMAVKLLNKDLDVLHNRFDQAVDPVMIDSIIYETQALETKYAYFLGMCKQRGIVAAYLN